MIAESLGRHWPHMKHGMVSMGLNLLAVLVLPVAALLMPAGMSETAGQVFILLWWACLLGAIVVGGMGLFEDDRIWLSVLGIVVSPVIAVVFWAP